MIPYEILCGRKIYIFSKTEIYEYSTDTVQGIGSDLLLFFLFSDHVDTHETIRQTAMGYVRADDCLFD